MGFNIYDFLNEESKKENTNDFIVKKIDIDLLDASEKNFYHVSDDEVKEIALTILLVGLKENLVVKPKENGRYEIVAGHKRYFALRLLINEGHEQFKCVPCKIEEIDPTVNELALIFTNSTQRERSDYEKMNEVKRIKELLEEYKKTHKLKGRMSEIIAQLMGTSKSTVGRLENIDNNLIQPLKEEYAKGNINTTTANKIASKKEVQQQDVYEEYKETGKISIPEVKEAVEIAETKEPKQDAINTEDLIVNGRINQNKEYNGIHITELQQLLMLNAQLDFKFWKEWVTVTNDGRLDLLEAYSGITGHCREIQYVFTDVSLNLNKAGNEAVIPLTDVREIINDLITKGRIRFNCAVHEEPEKVDDQEILQALKDILADRHLLTDQERCALISISRNIKERTEG